jgi:hypothetical protein
MTTDWTWTHTRNTFVFPALERTVDNLTQVITAGACWGYVLSTSCRLHLFETATCRNLPEALKTADNRLHAFAWDAFVMQPLPCPDDQARENRQYARDTREELADEGQSAGIVVCPDGSLDYGNVKESWAAKFAPATNRRK